MTQTVDVCVVGVDTLVGEAVLAMLAGRSFPAAAVHALSIGEPARAAVEYGERQLRLRDAEACAYPAGALVFSCGAPEPARIEVRRALAAGATVIDDSGAFRADHEVPLLVAGVNDSAWTDPADRLVSNPNGVVTLMLTALEPLRRAAGLQRVNVVTFQAVSGLDRRGVEELARQTAGLLSGRPEPGEVFPQRIAFNALPVAGSPQADGYTTEERKLDVETRRILGAAAPAVNATCVRVPVFFGHAAALHVELQRPVAITEVLGWLGASPELRLCTGEDASAWPTPALDASDGEAVLVGRVRADPTHPCGVDLWVVGDNVRRAAAGNMVRLAEGWLGRRSAPGGGVG